MKNDIFFSIVLCIFNGEKFIEEQFNSIIKQNFKNWELIIIDDKSSDESIKIINTLKKNVKNDVFLYKNNINKGVTLNFLNSFKISHGKWIVFCDQDDIWMPNKLEKIYDKIAKNKKVSAILHNGYYLINNKKTYSIGIGKNRVINNQLIYSKDPKFNLIYFFWRNRAVGCMSAFRKDFVKKYLYIYPPQNIYHDYWLSMITLMFSKFGYLDQPLIYYRRHDNNLTLLKNKNIISKMLDKLSLFSYLCLNTILYFWKKSKENKIR